MKTFKDIVQEDIRLSILRILASDTGYSHNEAVIKQALVSVGHAISLDAVRTQLAWLSEQDLIASDDSAGIVVATLTARGLDCSEGSATVPGVKRPTPGL